MAEFKSAAVPGEAIRIGLWDDGNEIGRVWIYLIRNNLHQSPYALIEDLFVEEPYRGRGKGRRLLLEAVETARRRGCYKVLATSRRERGKVHEMYLKAGFKDHGKEFRMEL